MSDRRKRALRVQFDGKLRLEFHGAKAGHAVKWARLSRLDFKDKPDPASAFRAGLQPGQLLRRLALPRSVKHWSLTTLREKLIKIGPKVVTHSRHVIFQMAEVAVPRGLFAAILDRIQRFGLPPPLVQPG